MKKVIFIALYCLLANTTAIFSQYKDSAALAKEMDRVNRLVDSMRPILAARDSATKVKLEEMLLNAQRGVEKHKQKEIEQATKKVVQRQEKEQKSKRNTMLLAGAAFLITVIVVRTFFKRKKRKG